MCKLKVFLLLLIWTSNVLSQEESHIEAEPKIDTFLKPPSTEGYSFISKLASWLNPFGGYYNQPSSDLETSQQKHAPQYQPPPHYPKKPCNPCNQEPWIPIAGTHGKNTLISFVKPSPPPIAHYGPPQPQHLNQAYGSPNDQTGYSSNNKFNVESSNSNYRTLTQNFMPPPPGLQNSNYRPLPPHPKPHQPFKQNKPFGPGFQKFVPPFTNYGVPIKPIQSNHLDLHSSNSQQYPQQYPQQYSQQNPNIHIQQTNHGNNGINYPPLGLQNPNLAPIPFPQLSRIPVLPLHNYQPFHSPDLQSNIKDNYPDHSIHNAQVAGDVQIIPSVQVGGVLSSIEHPINVIQSPLIELSAAGDEEGSPSNQIYDSSIIHTTNTPFLYENPIVVEDDIHAAASVQNATYEKRNNDKDTGNYFGFNEENVQNVINEELRKIQENKTAFTQPPLQFDDWTPYQTLTSSVVPPPINNYEWFSSTFGEQKTTKKPKPVQIIIPYTSQQSYDSNRESKKQNFSHKDKNTFEYAVPPKEESVWSNFNDHNVQESNLVTQTAMTNKPYTTVINIKDFIAKGEQWNDKGLPFNVKLQKNIDGWTEREYSKNSIKVHKDSTSSKLVPSKNIPFEYLTTLPYNQDVTTVRSEKKEHDSKQDIDSNLVLDDPPSVVVTTTSTETTSTTQVSKATPGLRDLLKSVWEMSQVTISPKSKEKVYVVTPEPIKFSPEELNYKLIRLAQYRNLPILPPKFSVLIDPNNRNKTKEVIKNSKDGLQKVYSEWPHLINNLLTTAVPEKSKSERPALFGLMDLSTYTPPPNSTVQTYGGHSKVITVVTPTSASKKKRKVPSLQI